MWMYVLRLRTHSFANTRLYLSFSPLTTPLLNISHCLGGGTGGVSSIVEKANENGGDEREGVRYHTLHERLLALKGSPLYLAPEVNI